MMKQETLDKFTRTIQSYLNEFDAEWIVHRPEFTYERDREQELFRLTGVIVRPPYQGDCARIWFVNMTRSSMREIFESPVKAGILLKRIIELINGDLNG